MKVEIKEYCVRCGICVGLYPELFAHNFDKCGTRLCGDSNLSEKINHMLG